jgi:hypothetical protein
MKGFPAARYAIFAVVGAVAAVVIFYVLSLLIGPHFEVGTDLIEGWIIRATCTNYTLTGATRDAAGKAVPFAVVEAIYDGQRLATRSGDDGRFKLASAKRVCPPQPDAVSVSASADGFRAARRILSFDQRSIVFTLER